LSSVPRGTAEHLAGIAHPEQAKALGWRGFSHLVTPPLLPASLERLKGKGALSQADKLSHQKADHAVKESRCLDLKREQIPLASQLDILNGRPSMRPATARPLKGAEVMFTQ